MSIETVQRFIGKTMAAKVDPAKVEFFDGGFRTYDPVRDRFVEWQVVDDLDPRFTVARNLIIEVSE